MPMSARLQYLFDRFLAKTCTDDERRELLGMALEPQMQQKINEIVGEAWMQTGEEEDVPEKKAEAIMEKIFPPASDVQERNVFPLIWKRIAVAASILLMIGIGSYFLFFNKPATQDEMVKRPELPNDVKAPEMNRAMIVLANGQKVYLDSANSGELAMQGNVKLVKLADGQISYSGNANATEVTYNTLTNPRGSKVISMTLADGSKVWLNAGSSLIYPVAFIGAERKVSITGEAYFEVSKHETMPFIVSKGEMEVTVLGTHFNVNAYDDETNLKVTLLEGSVKVTRRNADELLKPGQQAIIRQIQDDNDIKVVSNIDVEKVMAWKNGYFSFDNSDLQTVMRQIARWYDMDVSYEGEIPEMKFGGDISRNSTASEVLKILEKSKVHFRIEGKRIVVMP